MLKKKMTLAWILFYCGHAVWVVMDKFEWWGLYHLYNFLMTQSCRVQERADEKEPWSYENDEGTEK